MSTPAVHSLWTTAADRIPQIGAPKIEYGQLSPTLILLGAALVGVLVEAFVPRRSRYYAQVFVSVVALCAAFAAVALGWTRWASWRRLTTAGALTYSFYLVHEHLGWFVIRILHRFLGLPSAATLGATVLTMLTLAWLIHRFVEKPFGPRLRRALKTRNLSGA
ncbi:hypothetical protein GTW63_18565 [Streptomyces sp. SID6137]|nr:hypothetical protein [Streptomyces sp. SID6137]